MTKRENIIIEQFVNSINNQPEIKFSEVLDLAKILKIRVFFELDNEEYENKSTK